MLSRDRALGVAMLKAHGGVSLPAWVRLPGGRPRPAPVPEDHKARTKDDPPA